MSILVMCTTTFWVCWPCVCADNGLFSVAFPPPPTCTCFLFGRPRRLNGIKWGRMANGSFSVGGGDVAFRWMRGMCVCGGMDGLMVAVNHHPFRPRPRLFSFHFVILSLLLSFVCLSLFHSLSPFHFLFLCFSLFIHLSLPVLPSEFETYAQSGATASLPHPIPPLSALTGDWINDEAEHSAGVNPVRRHVRMGSDEDGWVWKRRREFR